MALPYRNIFRMVVLSLVATVIAKPIDKKDLVNADELKLFREIFAEPDVTVTPTSKPLNISFGNRNVIVAPCRSGSIKTKAGCREQYTVIDDEDNDDASNDE